MFFLIVLGYFGDIKFVFIPRTRTDKVLAFVPRNSTIFFFSGKLIVHFLTFKDIACFNTKVLRNMKWEIRTKCNFWDLNKWCSFRTQARTAAANGDVVEAQAQSIRARKLVIMSIVLGIIIYVFIIVIRVIFYSSYYALWGRQLRYFIILQKHCWQFLQWFICTVIVVNEEINTVSK